ncbi:MAG: NAD-dependent epimerase/dehydratase family protein [Rhodocyclales bacterium]|nr:NAD-dependent epimerase/dehydratase family protein [Rhodocyclales bacterium]
MRILVIGGAGFLGSAIVKASVEAGHAVRVYTRPTRSLERLEPLLDRIEVVHGDFLDDHAVGQSLQGIDAVVHALSTTFPKTVIASAAYDVMSNLLPTIRLVDLCIKNGVHNLTYLSSGGTIYGEARYLPIDEEHPRDPISLYGVSKLTIENYLHFIASVQPLVVKTLRISNPYGPSQNIFGVQGIVGVALGCLRSGRPFQLYGDGENVRDYIHVDDVARAVVSAIGQDESVVMNIGTGKGTSINELIAIIESLARRKLTIARIPDRGIDVKRNVLDSSRARTRLGWSPQIELADGLRSVIGSDGMPG